MGYEKIPDFYTATCMDIAQQQPPKMMMGSNFLEFMAWDFPRESEYSFKYFSTFIWQQILLKSLARHFQFRQ